MHSVHSLCFTATGFNRRAMLTCRANEVGGHSEHDIARALVTADGLISATQKPWRLDAPLHGCRQPVTCQ